MSAKFLTAVGIALVGGVFPAVADQFGSGANTFIIDFVTVGNAGNGNDTGTFPLGGVAYDYRMGVTEVSQDWVNKANNLGLPGFRQSGRWTGNQPATSMLWFEAAAFVNFLNTSTGHHAAYNLTYNGGITPYTMSLWSSGEAWQAGGENLYRNKDAYYFLPSENEWYKAAYHKNDGVTANYWNYPTQSDTAPTAVVSGTTAGAAVYNGASGSPANVDISGGLSGYGTMGQGGNVKEWMETAYSGSNNNANNDRTSRGGSVQDSSAFLLSEGTSASRVDSVPFVSDPFLGFRVASIVPEPSSSVLILTSGLAGALGWRTRAGRRRDIAA